MPRQTDDEIEVGRVKLRLAPSMTYMALKVQLVNGCVVRCSRLPLNDSVSTAVTVQRAVEQGKYSARNWGILTPEATPPSQSQGNTEPTSFSLGEELELSTTDDGSLEDPLAWMDSFNVLTQILLSYLATRQFHKLTKKLNRHKREIKRAELKAIANMLLCMPRGDAVDAIRAILQQTSSRRMRSMVTGVIIRLICGAPQNLPACARLMQIVEQYSLPLFDAKVNKWTSDLPRLELRLLLTDLFVRMEHLKSAVAVICGEDIIHTLMQKGHGIYKKQYNICIESISAVYRLIYERSEFELAVELAEVHLTWPLCTPEAENWSAVALATLITNLNCTKKEVALFLKKLMEKSIQLPEVLQRAALLRVKRSRRQELFKSLPAYALSHKALPALGRISKVLTLQLSGSWTNKEMQLAITWLLDSVKHRRTNYKHMHLTISVEVPAVRSDELTDVEVEIRDKVLAVMNPDPMGRLSEVLNRMELLIESAPAPNVITVISSSLAPYFN